MSSNSVPLDLDEPGTFLFTAERALSGHRLNKCALTLKSAANRDAFQADPEGYMQACDLSPAEVALVRARDWTGLLYAGGHVQAMLFFAASMGETLFDMGGHNAGLATAELLSICPRQVGGLPPSLAPASRR